MFLATQVIYHKFGCVLEYTDYIIPLRLSCAYLESSAAPPISVELATVLAYCIRCLFPDVDHPCAPDLVSLWQPARSGIPARGKVNREERKPVLR